MHDQLNGDFQGCREHVQKLPANCLFVVSSKQRQRHASTFPGQSLSSCACMDYSGRVYIFLYVFDLGTRLTSVKTQICSICSYIGDTATTANNHRIAPGLHYSWQTLSSWIVWTKLMMMHLARNLGMSLAVVTYLHIMNMFSTIRRQFIQSCSCASWHNTCSRLKSNIRQFIQSCFCTSWHYECSRLKDISASDVFLTSIILNNLTVGKSHSLALLMFSTSTPYSSVTLLNCLKCVHTLLYKK